MINVSDITKALKNIFDNNATMIKEGFTIERSEYVNLDEGRCPWIGIYKNTNKTDPATLGVHNSSWSSEITLKLIIQASHLNSGAECEDRLDRYLKQVKDAIWTEPTIGGYVEMVTGFDIEYLFEETESEEAYFQWAIINVTLEARTG